MDQAVAANIRGDPICVLFCWLDLDLDGLGLAGSVRNMIVDVRLRDCFRLLPCACLAFVIVLGKYNDPENG